MLETELQDATEGVSSLSGSELRGILERGLGCLV